MRRTRLSETVAGRGDLDLSHEAQEESASNKREEQDSNLYMFKTVLVAKSTWHICGFDLYGKLPASKDMGFPWEMAQSAKCTAPGEPSGSLERESPLTGTCLLANWKNAAWLESCIFRASRTFTATARLAFRSLFTT